MSSNRLHPGGTGIYWLDIELVQQLQKSSTVNSNLLEISDDCKHICDYLLQMDLIPLPKFCRIKQTFIS